jgi:predicted permease
MLGNGRRKMRMLWQDLRYAVRMLAHTPGCTTVAVLTLALSIGTSTAIFSQVNALWFNPIPAAEPDRLVGIGLFYSSKGFDQDLLSPVIVQELRAHRECFAGLARIEMWPNRRWLDERTGWLSWVSGFCVSADYFSFWNVRPYLGRTFASDEGRPGAPPVIVLSHEFWKNKLGGDPSWLGKPIRIQDTYYTVIGVMPPYFKNFPYPASDEYWVTADDPEMKAADQDPKGLQYKPSNGIIARLAPGVSREQAQALVDVLAQRHEEEVRKYGWRRTTLRVRPLREAFARPEVQSTIPGFVGAMIFVVLIACANVANLNLVRIEARQHELCVRGALGAGRMQLLRQLLLESLLPALIGGIAGIALTYLGFSLMERLLPYYIPRLRPIELDWRVVAYCVLVAVAAGLVSGTVPAWYGATRPVAEVLKQSGVQMTPGLLRNLYRRGLVVLEVSLAMVLLVGAGLMVQSVARMLRTDLGLDPGNLIYVCIGPCQDSKKYRTLEAKNLVLDEVHRRLSALPGVEAVGILSEGRYYGAEFIVAGQEKPIMLHYRACGVGTADPFKARRVPLLRGRYLDEVDVQGNATAVVVNETLAQLCWPDDNPIGKTIRSTAANDPSTFEVVGVVGDVRSFWGVTQPIGAWFWRPHQVGFTDTQYALFVRTGTDPRGLIKPLLAELKAAVPELSQPRISLVKDEFFNSTRSHRIYMCYLGVLGAVGLLLAGVGVYALLAYSVALRGREIGIRMALGAAEAGVVQMVLRQGMTLVGIGIALGLGAAWALTRFLRAMLYEVSPMDPLALAAGALVLSLVALLACYIPARRAARIDPMVALRYE